MSSCLVLEISCNVLTALNHVSCQHWDRRFVGLFVHRFGAFQAFSGVCPRFNPRGDLSHLRQTRVHG
jgi:hypothetical protein